MTATPVGATTTPATTTASGPRRANHARGGAPERAGLGEPSMAQAYRLPPPKAPPRPASRPSPGPGRGVRWHGPAWRGTAAPGKHLTEVVHRARVAAVTGVTER